MTKNMWWIYFWQKPSHAVEQMRQGRSHTQEQHRDFSFSKEKMTCKQTPHFWNALFFVFPSCGTKQFWLHNITDVHLVSSQGNIRTFIHSTIQTLPHTQKYTDLVKSVVLVLEAGHEARVDLQGVVVGSQLERQGRVTLLLKTPVGIQHLQVRTNIRTCKTNDHSGIFTNWLFAFSIF